MNVTDSAFPWLARRIVTYEPNLTLFLPRLPAMM